MSESALLDKIDALTRAVEHLSALVGARLTHAEVCARLRIHRNSLKIYIARHHFPQPGRDGKWLLSEIVEWEARR